MREIRTSGLMWRGLETEPWNGLRHRQSAKAAGNSYSPIPKVTAPALDPTSIELLISLYRLASIYNSQNTRYIRLWFQACFCILITWNILPKPRLGCWSASEVSTYMIDLSSRTLGLYAYTDRLKSYEAIQKEHPAISALQYFSSASLHILPIIS